MTQTRKSDVFVSYTSKDRAWASEFADTLAALGIRAWHDTRMVRAGEDWAKQIEEALRESRILCVVVSPESMKSEWTLFELGAAVADKKLVIPVLTEQLKLDDLRPPLSQFYAVAGLSPSEAARHVAKIAAATANEA